MSHNEIKTRPGAKTGTPVESIRLDGIAGTWFNTNGSSHEIAKVELSCSAGKLLIHAYGAEDDWGEVPVAAHVSPDQPDEMTGFEAHFESGAVERHLAANLKLGVLVIQCYKHVRGDEQGGSYFTREFFHQRIETCSEPAGAASLGDSGGLPYAKAGDWLENTTDAPAGGADLTPHLGAWRNTYRHTRGISHLELLRDGETFLVHAHGVAAQRDWGAVSALAYANSVGSRHPSGFSATYVFEFMEMRLSANFNKGLLIVAAYNRFHDGSGRSDYFTREFFYHEPAAEV